jgi:hypothetical protein
MLVFFYCFLDVNMAAVTIQSGLPSEGALDTLEATITIANIAPGRSGNDILPSLTIPSGSTNFKYSLFFSDGNVRLGERNTLSLAKIDMAPTGAEPTLETLKAAITVAVKVTRIILIANGKCLGIRYLCFQVEEGTNANYIDADPSNNVYCFGMTSSPRIKNCKPGKLCSFSSFQSLHKGTSTEILASNLVP